MSRLYLRFQVIALLALALTGCVQAKIELPSVGDRATIVENLPVSIGVYYDQRFREYVYRQCLATGGPPPCPFAGFPVEVELGEVSVALFDRILRALFETVQTIETRQPPVQDAQKLAAIIEPAIVNYVLDYGMSSRRWRATITYALVLRTTDGSEIVRWTFSVSESAGPGLAPTSVRKATHDALRAAEAQALVGFHKQPDIKSWLLRRGIGETGVEKRVR